MVFQVIRQGREEVHACHLFDFIHRYDVFFQRTFTCFVLEVESDGALLPAIVNEDEAGERPLKEYIVSVDKIEKMTGMDFFSALPDDLENQLEKEILENLP